MKRKNNFTFFLLSIIFTNCSTFRPNREMIKQFKTIYPNEFKLSYVQSLLKVGFNQPHALDSLFSQDGSNYSEPILSFDDMKLIDSLVHSENEKMRSDSIARIGNVAEGGGGKHVLKYVLMRYASKQLDSIANASYLIWKKNQKAYYGN